MPVGNTALRVRTLAQVELSGLSGSAPTSASNTNEIVRTAPPVRNVYTTLPQIYDGMVLVDSAGGDGLCAASWV